MLQPLKTYQFLHRPFRILWFESDELFLILAGLILGIYVHVSFVALPVVVVPIARKIKKRYPRGFLKHISYFAGIYRFKGMPSFTENRFNE